MTHFAECAKVGRLDFIILQIAKQTGTANNGTLSAKPLLRVVSQIPNEKSREDVRPEFS